MSDMANEPESVDQGEVISGVEPQVTENQVTETQSENEMNPAWNPLLEALPSSLHSLATPHLQQWDRNYQENIQKIHTQYEPYKPFLEGQVAPEQINYSLQLMQALEERPQDILKALQGYVDSLEPQEAKPNEAPAPENGDENEYPEELLNHPKFVELQQQVNNFTEMFTQAQQKQQADAEDAALEGELKGLIEKHGEFDLEYVITKALHNPEIPIENHVLAYKEMVNEVLSKNNRPPAPRLLGNGGRAPDNQLTKGDLNSPAARKAAIESILAANKK